MSEKSTVTPPLAAVTSRGALRRRLYVLAWPSVLENLLHSLVFMINTALVGRLGAEALGAAGIANHIMFFVITPVYGFAAGLLAIVARAIGRNDLADAQRASRHAFTIGMGFTIVVSVLLMTLAAPILHAAGADAEVVALGSPFLRVASIFTVFQTGIMLLGAVLRGAGDTRTPMVATMVMTIIDGVGGYLLVFDVIGPGGLGLMGVAVAFSVARVVAFGYIFVAFAQRPIGWRWWRGSWMELSVFRRLIRVGGPAAAEQTMTFGGIFVTQLMALRLGTVQFATHSVIGPITSLPFTAAVGLSFAAATSVGQCLGARRPDLARRYGVEANAASIVMAGGFGAVMVAFPEWLMSLYTTDPSVVSLGIVPLRVVGLFIFLYGPANVLPGVLRGAGDTKSALWIAIVALWFVRVPVAFVLTFGLGMGLLGLWLALGAGYVTRVSIATWLFVRGRWQTVEV